MAYGTADPAVHNIQRRRRAAPLSVRRPTPSDAGIRSGSARICGPGQQSAVFVLSSRGFRSVNCGFHCWRVSPPFIVMFQAQSATRGVRGMCPLKAGKPGARIRRAARLSTFVHTNVLLAILCDRKTLCDNGTPFSPSPQAPVGKAYSHVSRLFHEDPASFPATLFPRRGNRAPKNVSYFHTA